MTPPPPARLGYRSTVLLAINGIVGLGIFISPGGVVRLAGVWTPLVYVIAGLFAAILATTFASAAKYVTANGSAYAYATAAFGGGAGLYVGVTRYVAASIGWGVLVTAVVKTTLAILGLPAGPVTVTAGFLLLMLVLLGISLSGTAVTRVFSNISTVGKIGVLTLFIVAGAGIVLGTGQSHYGDVLRAADAHGRPLVAPPDPSRLVSALLAAFYAYAGFEAVATAASEVDRPHRTLPRAIRTAVIIIVLVYVGTVGIAMMLDPVALLTSQDPVVLAAVIDHPLLRGLVIGGALISMFGITVASAFNTPRLFEAIAVRGQLPRALARTSRRGVPVPAFLVTAAMALAVPMAFGYDMRGILVISSVSRFVQFLVVPLAVIAFFLGRSREPLVAGAPRSILTDLVVPAAALVSSLLLLSLFDWRQEFSVVTADGSLQLNLWAVGAMLAGYVVLPAAFYLPWRLGWYGRGGR